MEIKGWKDEKGEGRKRRNMGKGEKQKRRKGKRMEGRIKGMIGRVD